MSTNIQYVQYDGNLTIEENKLYKFLEKYEKELPDRNVCEYSVRGGKIYYEYLSGPKNGIFRIESLDWSGTGSGYAYKTLLEFLKLTNGKADIILTWEGNPSEGMKVNDGKITKAKVKITLE